MSTAGIEPSDSTRSRRGGLRLRIPGFTSLQSEVPASAPVIDPAELNARRDRTAAAALPLLTASLGMMLLLSSFFRLQPLDTPAGLLGAGLSAVCGVALLVASIVIARGRPDSRSVEAESVASAHAAVLGVLLIATVVLCIAMLAAATLAQTAYVQLLIVVAGATMLRPGWYAVAIGSIWSLWLGSAAVLSGTQDASGWVLAMLAASVVSVVLHTMRTDSLRALGSALLAAEAEAVRDSLTGLLNRRGMEVVGHEVLALARRGREPLSCTFVDVDGLKEVNDKYGHNAGDSLIIAVADALVGVFRQADVVARWGGDEFVVLALGAGPRIEDVDRRLQTRLAGVEVVHHGQWTPSLSCGRVVHMPWQEETLEQITERADQEMYRRRRLRRAQDADRESS